MENQSKIIAQIIYERSKTQYSQLLLPWCEIRFSSHKKINYGRAKLSNVHVRRFLKTSEPSREGAKISKIIVIWDLHVLGGIELLLHLSDLLLIDLDFSWSKNWGLNQRKSWLAKEKKFTKS
jgi:hypothetical protein